MAGPDDVRKIAKDNFENAHANLDQDLADAKTPLEARAVRRNHDQAMARYMDAISVSLECTSGDWQQALADARQAQADVEEARARAAAFDQRLARMAELTGKVATLVEAAKG